MDVILSFIKFQLNQSQIFRVLTFRNLWNRLILKFFDCFFNGPEKNHNHFPFIKNKGKPLKVRRNPYEIHHRFMNLHICFCRPLNVHQCLRIIS